MWDNGANTYYQLARSVDGGANTCYQHFFSGEECRRRSSSMIFYLSSSGEECRRCCELNGFLSFFFWRGVSTAVELNSGLVLRVFG